METTKRNYSQEFKIKAVELSNQRGSIVAVARELNIRDDMLRRWIKEHAQGRFSPHPSPVSKSKEELEIHRLRKELLEAQLERDILKKAVSIFSKSGR
jgi:transposase